MTRILGIDLLRGLSILYIVGFWHLLNYTKAVPEYNNLITYRLTWIVLGTFVLISGYFIGRKDIPQNTLLYFYKKRFTRIYPPYLIALAIFSLLGLSSGMTTVKAILCISMFIRPAPPTLWFITMLIFFYLIAPALICLSKQGIYKYLFLYVILFCSLLGCEYISNLLFNYYYLDIRVAVYLAPFMTGIFIAQKNIMRFNIKLIFLVSIFTFIISCYFNSDNWGLNLLYSIPVVTMAPLLLIIIFSRFSLNSSATQRIIIFLSTSSYFMYLFHRPFYIVLKKIYFPTTEIKQLLYLFGICLPFIIIASFIMQKIYDNILNSLTKRSS